MITALHSLTAPPPKDWSCIACHKDGNSFDLITHEGCREQCIFHRRCYSNSNSAITGQCQDCRAPLHKYRPAYIASDADMYQMRDLARCFRAAQKAARGRESFDYDDFRKNVMRSGSWSWYASHKKVSTKDRKSVYEYMRQRAEEQICEDFRQDVTLSALSHGSQRKPLTSDSVISISDL